MARSDDGTNDEEDDAPETHREHRLAKNPRATDPDEAGPRDPAAEMHEAAGTGSGLEDVLEGDGDVSKSTQAELEDALGDVDFLGGAEPVEKGDGDTADLSWSDEDFNPPTEADLLAQIRDELELARMSAEDREHALKSVTTDARHGTDGATEAADALAAFDRLEQDRERADELGDLLEDYVDASPEHGLEDPLAEVTAWLREQAEEMADGEERRRVTDALDRLPETGRTPA
jgi:hypothetical protein